MQKTTIKVERRYQVIVDVKVGDIVTASSTSSYKKINGKITHIFDQGKQALVDDEEVIRISTIKDINGVSTKDIEGPMTRV